MTLSLALRSALSSMQAVQTGFQVAAGNVSNAGNPDYSRKKTSQSSRVTEGLASGVQIDAIRRVVDENLNRLLRAQRGVTANLSVQDRYFDRIQQFFGSPGSNTGPGHRIGRLGTALEALGTTPENISVRTRVITMARQLAGDLASLATALQDMRQEADADIATITGQINTDIADIARLNTAIATARARNEPVGEFRDQRDTALARIARNMEISSFERPDGSLAVFTPAGRPLLDRVATELAHRPAARLDGTLTWPNGIDAIAHGPGGPDITAELRGGRLGALLGLRDRDLVDIQAELDGLAESMVEAVNAAHNQGTAFPAPAKLTGSQIVHPADAPAMSGHFRVTALAPDGTLLESLDIDIATLAPPTIGQLVATIDAMTNLTASINAAGKVEIAATGTARVAVAEGDSAVTTGSKTRGLAHFLGLNNMFDSPERYSRHFSDRLGSATAPLGRSGTLTLAFPGGTASVSYATGDSLNDLAAAIDSHAGLAAQNVQAAVRNEADGVRLELADADGDNIFLTDSGNLLAAHGIRAGQAGAASRFGLRPDLQADPNRLAIAALPATPSTVGAPALAPGDATVAHRLAAVFSEDTDFAATGGLPGGTTRIADRAAAIVARNATGAESIREQFRTGQARETALANRAGAVSQVNIDEEMAQIIILQQTYTASARVTTTVSKLLDELLATLR